MKESADLKRIEERLRKLLLQLSNSQNPDLQELAAGLKQKLSIREHTKANPSTIDSHKEN